MFSCVVNTSTTPDLSVWHKSYAWKKSILDKIYPVKHRGFEIGRNRDDDVLLRIHIDYVSTISDCGINLLFRMNNDLSGREKTAGLHNKKNTAAEKATWRRCLSAFIIKMF